MEKLRSILGGLGIRKLEYVNNGALAELGWKILLAW